ncbi:MAG: DUF368 domain-containing protein [Acidimicrobiaceae bacterium]|nr:DUF368 domain-containing protein [Acidimicrobiaceae bacterium]
MSVVERLGRGDGSGRSRWSQLLLGLARGAAMGAADVVPGVSGATVAVVIGIYSRLLQAVSTASAAAARLLALDWRGCRSRLAGIDWQLIGPLLAGLLATLGLLASLIERLLADHPEPMAGLLCGLVLASVVTACRLFDWRGAAQIVLVVATAGATFALLGLQSAPVADPSLLALAGAGAVSVCAMILPGISGAFLLLMMGMYAAVIGVVTDVRWLQALVFLAGAALGLALFSSLLHRLLERARNIVMAVLVGLMVGSLRVLWPWPDGVGVISRHEDQAVSGTGLEWPAADEWALPTVAAAAGFATVLALTRLSHGLLDTD